MTPKKDPHPILLHCIPHTIPKRACTLALLALVLRLATRSKDDIRALGKRYEFRTIHCGLTDDATTYGEVALGTGTAGDLCDGNLHGGRKELSNGAAKAG